MTSQKPRRRIGDYEVLTTVGRGAYAAVRCGVPASSVQLPTRAHADPRLAVQVYLAKHVVTQQPVAIKSIVKSGLEPVNQAQLEISLLQKHKHPNIVNLLEHKVRTPALAARAVRTCSRRRATGWQAPRLPHHGVLLGRRPAHVPGEAQAVVDGANAAVCCTPGCVCALARVFVRDAGGVLEC